VNNWTSSRYK